MAKAATASNTIKLAVFDAEGNFLRAVDGKPLPFDEKGEYTGPVEFDLELSRPVKLHKDDPNVLTSIHLEEPTVDQLAAFADESNKTRNDVAASRVLISKNAGISLAQAGKLSSRDMQKAIDFLTGFTPPSPMDGVI